MNAADTNQAASLTQKAYHSSDFEHRVIAYAEAVIRLRWWMRLR